MTTEKTAAAEQLAAAAAEATKLSESEALALALAQVNREAEAVAGADLQYGDNVLVAGAIAAQVNALTAQSIPHGTPVVVKYDRWIEIQLGAGVLVRHKL